MGEFTNKDCQPCKKCPCTLLETMGLSCANIEKDFPYLLQFTGKNCAPNLVGYTPQSVTNQLSMIMRVTVNRINPPAPPYFLPGNFGASLGDLDNSTPTSAFTLTSLYTEILGDPSFFSAPQLSYETYGTNQHLLFKISNFRTPQTPPAPYTAYKTLVVALNNPTGYSGFNFTGNPADTQFSLSSMVAQIVGRSDNEFKFGLAQTQSPTSNNAFSQASMLATPLAPIMQKSLYGGTGNIFGNNFQFLIAGTDTYQNPLPTVPTTNNLDFLIIIQN